MTATPTDALRARIINLYLNHVPSSHIARKLGISRITVNHVLREFTKTEGVNQWNRQKKCTT